MKIKITKLRLNEAGDFRNQEEIKKWNKIAGRLRKDHGIATYAYTARSDLDFSKAPNIIINGSNPGTLFLFSILLNPLTLLSLRLTCIKYFL